MTVELPKGWAQTTLGSVCKVEYGKGLSKRQRVETGSVGVYGSAGLAGRHNQALVEEPVVIVGRKGNAGAVWHTKEPSWPIDTTYFLRVPSGICAQYLAMQLGHLDLVEHDSSTTIPSLRRPDLEAASIAIAPSAEQKRIGAAIEEHFSRLGAAATALHSTLLHLEALKSSTLGHAFHTGGELPKGWKLTTIGESCYKPQYGWTTKSSVDEGLSYLRTTDISGGSVDWRRVPVCTSIPDNINKYLLRDGDIVVCRAGSVGVSLLIESPPEAIFASYLIRLRTNETMMPEYLSYYLKSPMYWASIADNSSGIAIPNVNASKLAGIHIPVAPRAEQEQVVR